MRDDLLTYFDRRSEGSYGDDDTWAEARQAIECFFDGLRCEDSPMRKAHLDGMAAAMGGTVVPPNATGTTLTKGPLVLTDDQRAHAIEALGRAIHGYACGCSEPWPTNANYEEMSQAALAALLKAGYHVLHPDDVKRNRIDECGFCRICGELCTRWESITDPADPQKETT